VKIGGYEIHPAATIFPLMEGEEFESLCEDIEKHGVRDPAVLIQVGDEKQLLDGRNRIRAAEKAGASVKTVMYDGDDPLGYVLSANLHRRHLNEAQRAMVAAKIKPMFEEQAKKRQEATQFGSQTEEPGDDTVVENLPPPAKGKSRDQAAAATNVSGRSVSKAEKVIAGGCDELNAAVNQGGLSLDLAENLAKRPVDEQREILEKIAEFPKQNAKAVVRRHDKDKVIARLRGEPQPPPEGPFRVIAVDVSWSYDKRPDDGTQRGQTPYPTMTIDEIYALGEMVEGLAHDNCILWMWVTNAHMPKVYDILDVWGFEGKTILTWKKPKMGTGDWLRGITEHCILAVRGKPKVDLSNQTTHIEGAVREHSRKPEEFYQLVESLCPGSKLEMFATEAREGWQMWAPGNWREEGAAAANE
jgi:N6-adenosine-specific RNA methylase IME4